MITYTRLDSIYSAKKSFLASYRGLTRPCVESREENAISGLELATRLVGTRASSPSQRSSDLRLTLTENLYKYYINIIIFHATSSLL